MTGVREIAQRAKRASRIVATLTGEQRNAALAAMARALEENAEALFAANAEDIAAAEDRGNEEPLAASVLARLKLDEAKLREMSEQIRSVAALPDPLGRLLDEIELDDKDPAGTGDKEKCLDIKTSGLHLQKLSVPLGVLAVIFEARPDAVTQIAALALKSGNSVVLKPGREVERTAVALVDALRRALRQQGFPEDAVTLVLGRERAAELLTLHDLVDLVIPRGSKALVDYVQSNTRIPVLGHAEGVCHIYVDAAADQAMALRVIEDAKLDYPAACNAVETVLVHHDIAAAFLPKLAQTLQTRGVRLHGDGAARSIITAEPVTDWHTEFGAAEVAIGIVASMDAAIEHIQQHGSLHTESIVTEDRVAAERFLREVDAASVFWNASTRFADGFRYGFGAEVGISTSKFHARGPVGLDGLTTYKYVLRGHGHIAGEYRGVGARSFTHRRNA